MLADPSYLGNPLLGVEESLFDPQFWSARGELDATPAGRGAAWFVGSPQQPWVLRRFQRGGQAATLSRDRYLWMGERSVRAFSEARLLHTLHAQGLPVPQPVAAWYRRSVLTYRCDLITARIVDAVPLSAALAVAPLQDGQWRHIGAVLSRFHHAGVEHADLNAHNILLTPGGAVYVIDFDRGRQHANRYFAAANMARLHRSLHKIAAQLPAERFSTQAWEALLTGYLHVDAA